MNCSRKPRQALAAAALAAFSLLQLSAADNLGYFDAPGHLPLVPVAIALGHDNKLVCWSAYLPDGFAGAHGYTVTATIDLATMEVSEKTVANTHHDMFCPGISMLPDGRVHVSGGSDAGATSIYDPANDGWVASGPLVVGRGYQGQTTMPDGRVFTLGGSWSGDPNVDKPAEVWSPEEGWKVLPGIDVTTIYTNDPTSFPARVKDDNFAWLFPVSGNTVFHAGPSTRMNFFSLEGDGANLEYYTRGDDTSKQYGNARMFAPNQILAVGGQVPDGSASSNTAFIITITGPTSVEVKQVASMKYHRTFCNSVVLPNGKIIVYGGQEIPQVFTDTTPVYEPEMYDVATDTWTVLAPAATPRTYHSTALLLPDGRVFTGGGGLCNPAVQGYCPEGHVNHEDFEMHTPPYLLEDDGITLAARPTITEAPEQAGHGAEISVATDGDVETIVLMRVAATTHAIDNDQRRLPLPILSRQGNTYQVKVPDSDVIALSGYYMLFVLNGAGVPSTGHFIKIGGQGVVVPTVPDPKPHKPHHKPGPKPQGARVCRIMGKSWYQMYDVADLEVPEASRSTAGRLAFCTAELLKLQKEGAANAVFSTDGTPGKPYNWHCYFKLVPAEGAAPLVDNPYYPNGHLIVVAGTGGVC